MPSRPEVDAFVDGLKTAEDGRRALLESARKMREAYQPTGVVFAAAGADEALRRMLEQQINLGERYARELSVGPLVPMHDSDRQRVRVALRGAADFIRNAQAISAADSWAAWGNEWWGAVKSITREAGEAIAPVVFPVAAIVALVVVVILALKWRPAAA